MKNTFIYLFIIPLIFLSTSCKENGQKADAFGNFEVEELMISSEMPGKILYFNADEGSRISQGELIAIIDTNDLILKREQLLARKRAVSVNKSGVIAEIAVLEEQAVSLTRELDRTASLLKKGAAPQRQFDELEGQLKVVNKKISAIRTRNSSILLETEVIDAQINEIDANITKCKVFNPVTGIVMVSYTEAFEMTAPGRPLYKIANLDTLFLRAYISGNQLSSIKLGQALIVQYDGPDGEIQSLDGVLTWVSSEAEFTPKIIQTREDRVNMVYAIKVKVANDGSLKIGMPGEVIFKQSESAE